MPTYGVRVESCLLIKLHSLTMKINIYYHRPRSQTEPEPLAVASRLRPQGGAVANTAA